MPTYNEDVQRFIVDRYDLLGLANRHIRQLIDSRNLNKFSDSYSTKTRNQIEEFLNIHFSADPNLPDLDDWEGENAPQRIYLGAGGYGATAVGVVISGVVESYTITDPGSYYSFTPVVSVFGVAGSGASALAVLGEVTDIVVTNTGIGYTSPPTVTVSNPDDSNGVLPDLAVSLDGNSAPNIAVRMGGSGYTSIPTVTISGGGGSGATAVASIDPGVVSDVVPDNGGQGYISANEVFIDPVAPPDPSSTDAERADDDYIPAGWERNLIDVNGTNQRYVYRSERRGYFGNWEEWSTPELLAEYTTG